MAIFIRCVTLPLSFLVLDTKRCKFICCTTIYSRIRLDRFRIQADSHLAWNRIQNYYSPRIRLDRFRRTNPPATYPHILPLFLSAVLLKATLTIHLVLNLQTLSQVSSILNVSLIYYFKNLICWHDLANI